MCWVVSLSFSLFSSPPSLSPSTHTQKENGAKALPLLEKALRIESTYLPALIDSAIAFLYMGEYEAVNKALVKVDRQSPGHGAAKKIREAMGRGKAPKGNAARRSMMGQRNNQGPPKHSKHAKPHAGPKKEFSPDAVHSAQSMLHGMRQQLESEVARRKKLGVM
jgi:hypothetical protein